MTISSSIADVSHCHHLGNRLHDADHKRCDFYAPSVQQLAILRIPSVNATSLSKRIDQRHNILQFHFSEVIWQERVTRGLSKHRKNVIVKYSDHHFLNAELYVKAMSFASSSSESCTARDYSVSSSQCSIANQSIMRKFFDNLENEGTRRITEFTRYTQKCLEESEQAKPFIFPVGMYPEGENPINLQSTHGIDFYEDYDEMAMREREISAKLKKIKAMAFVLESEQHTLRKRLSHGGTS